MSEEPDQERCETCRFYKEYDVDWQGACRRYPPLPVIRETAERNCDNEHFEQPWVNGLQDWCGEYQARKPLPVVPDKSERPLLGSERGRDLVTASLPVVPSEGRPLPALVKLWRDEVADTLRRIGAGEFTEDEIETARNDVEVIENCANQLEKAIAEEGQS